MRVLITGGAGFIGSHLSDALVARGDDVTILDNLSTGSEINIEHLSGKIEKYQGDIRDQKLSETLIENCDLVFHMAAALGVDNILENPVESISTNFHGSEIILNAAAKFNKRILIASTSEIYGKNPNQPLSESDDRVIGTPQKLRWTYSDAKALEESIAHYLFLSKNLKVTTLRLFNTVGPRQTGKYGMVIPRFIEAAIQGKPLNIFGNGLQSRVFCHVNDVVKAMLTVCDSDNTLGQVFNIGGKGEISIQDLAKLIIKYTNSSSSLKFIEYSDAYSQGYEDMQRRIPNISKIKSFTGWEPKLTLENIIHDTVQYFTKKI
jgi:UDP-glucose 4-epimerase